jgi:hypothetical protein
MAVNIVCAALGVAAALATAALAAASRARTRRWRVVCVVLPGAAAVLALFAAWGGVGIESGGGVAERVVVLVDVSGSARGEPWRDPAWVERLARRRLLPGTRVTVVTFGGEGVRCAVEEAVVGAPGEEGRWPSAWAHFGEGVGSDVAAGLAWRTPEEARGGALAPRWVITDGLVAWPAEAPAAATVIPPAADVGVSDVAVRGGAELWARVRAVGGLTVADVELARNGEVIGRERVTFETGGGARWVTAPVADAGGVFEVRVRGAGGGGGDAFPENDVGRAAGPGAARVLRIGKGEGLPGDAWQLAAAGWQVVTVEGELGAREWRTLDAFVRQTGGGVVVRGEALGGELPAVGEKLLPVTRVRQEGTAAEVVVLLDASASMNESAGTEAGQKFSLAARGVSEGVAALRAEDRVTVAAFNSEAHVVAAGTAEQVQTTLGPALAAVRPAGGTVPDAALPAAEAALAGEASHKWVVLLTDGEVAGMDAAAWRAVLSRAGGRLVVVAPRAARQGPLAELADVWLDGDAPERWPALLRTALGQVERGEARHDPLAWRGPAQSAGTAAAWRELWKKPDARVLATGEARDGTWTAAAVAERGLGRTAAVAADDETLVRQAIDAVTPRAGDRRFAVRAQRAATGWQIVADGVEAGRFVDRASLAVRGAGETTPMLQTGPGHYVANVAGAAGAVVVRGDAEVLVARVNAADVAAEEWPATVEAGAPPAGAQRLRATGEGLWRPRVGGRWVDVSPALWGASAAAALAAVWGRRAGAGRR